MSDIAIESTSDATTLGVVEEYTAAYLARDATALSRLYSPRCRLVAPGISLERPGGVRAMWAAWFRAFPDVSSTFDRRVINGRVAVLEWTERGTHTGELRMAGAVVPATGKTVVWQGATILEIEDGLIASHTWHFDRLQLTFQLLSLRSLIALARTVLRLRREQSRVRTKQGSDGTNERGLA